MSIPRRPARNDDLVVLPRKEYEAFVRAKNSTNDAIVVKRTLRVPKKHERFYTGVDKQLTKSPQEIRAGKVSQPFDFVKGLIQSLES